MKQCTKCHETRPLDQFSKDRRTKDGLQYTCKPCAKSWHSRRRAERHGLTYTEQADLLRFQAMACAICSAVLTPGSEGHALDHCHTSEKLRAALCNRCNVAIGMLGDSPQRARAVADYIEWHRAQLGHPAEPVVQETIRFSPGGLGPPFRAPSPGALSFPLRLRA